MRLRVKRSCLRRISIRWILESSNNSQVPTNTIERMTKKEDIEEEVAEVVEEEAVEVTTVIVIPAQSALPIKIEKKMKRKRHMKAKRRRKSRRRRDPTKKPSMSTKTIIQSYEKCNG